jgi:hypothetical protein
VSDFILRFDNNLIRELAGRYPVEHDSHVEGEIAPAVRARGHLAKAELVKLCRWKTPRTGPRVAQNAEGFVRAVTGTALSTANEQLRIEVLTLLRGVGWPTASVLLHFCHPDRYPILDYRALWSLSVEVPHQYDHGFWSSYSRYCRQLAELVRVSMRVLDRALWQYSSENQPR